MMPVSHTSYAPAELLGPLNPIEEKHAPSRLFVAGDPAILKAGPRVSIVGARKASDEGLRRAARLARLLVERDVTVVSGLARGIDTAAHRTTIEIKGGRTIAVIGTSLSEAYPPENRPLQDRLMCEQLVVSQFASGVPIRKANFPQRNRTMALLTDASVIIEAGDGSGSLSQGWEALRLGRPLFITKTVAEDNRLTWPTEMMQYGAQVLSERNLESLFDALPVWAREVSVDAHPF
jgi:DNA processing protein